MLDCSPSRTDRVGQDGCSDATALRKPQVTIGSTPTAVVLTSPRLAGFWPPSIVGRKQAKGKRQRWGDERKPLVRKKIEGLKQDRPIRAYRGPNHEKWSNSTCRVATLKRRPAHLTLIHGLNEFSEAA
jgi:hypothetical protein